jgi:hypothetical protein
MYEKKKEKDDTGRMKNCQFCASNDLGFLTKGFFTLKWAVRCRHCEFRTHYYRKPYKAIEEWNTTNQN